MRKPRRTKTHKIAKGLQEAVSVAQGLQVGNAIRIILPKDYVVRDGPPIDLTNLTPYEQLDKAITDLENRILNTVARIKSLGI